MKIADTVWLVWSFLAFLVFIIITKEILLYLFLVSNCWFTFFQFQTFWGRWFWNHFLYEEPIFPTSSINQTLCTSIFGRFHYHPRLRAGNFLPTYQNRIKSFYLSLWYSLLHHCLKGFTASVQRGEGGNVSPSVYSSLELSAFQTWTQAQTF